MIVDSEHKFDLVCRLCSASGDEVNLKKCSKCRSVRYCSKDHQVEDWRRHKLYECKNLAEKREMRKELKLKGYRKEDFEVTAHRFVDSRYKKI